MDKRKKAIELIAKQCATQAGYIWREKPDANQSKVQARYMTLAGSILATVERLAKVTWS